MIITLTPNPSVDRTLHVPQLRFNEVLRAHDVRVDWGGKGFNVSRALRILNEETLALAWVGGGTGRMMQHGLNQLGIKTDFVWVEEETRINTVAQEDSGQLMLPFVEANRKRGKEITGYEYAVLVTNSRYEILTLGQLYRDRADAENAFDELKNQWGWGGYTTHDLHRCQLAARAVALIYNWWSLFVRLAHPEARREAITSRPWLMSSVMTFPPKGITAV